MNNQKKLELNKKTIATLDHFTYLAEDEMNNIQGGTSSIICSIIRWTLKPTPLGTVTCPIEGGMSCEVNSQCMGTGVMV